MAGNAQKGVILNDKSAALLIRMNMRDIEILIGAYLPYPGLNGASGYRLGKYDGYIKRGGTYLRTEAGGSAVEIGLYLSHVASERVRQAVFFKE